MDTTPLFLWNLYPERFADVTQGEKVICVNQGGTSSGKTYTILQVLFHKAIFNAGWTISVVGQDIPNLKRGAIKDADTIVKTSPFFRQHIESYNKTDKTYFFKNGSKIEFLSLDNLQDAKSGKREGLFINEANGIDYSIYNELNMRTTYCTYIDYNPNAEFWVHEKVIGGENVAYFISNYTHNPFLHPNIKKEILKLKDIDDNLWRVYGMGQTGKVIGVIFDTVQVDLMPNNLKKEAYGLDFGFSNDPTVLVRGGLSDGKLYGEELIYEKGLTNSEIVRIFKELGVPKNAPIFADSADPKSIHEIKSYGYNIKGADKGRDSIDFSINLIKGYGKVHLTRNSPNWQKEALAYKWAEDKTGKALNRPIDAFNHAWDAYRYWAIGMLTPRSKGLLAFG